MIRRENNIVRRLGGVNGLIPRGCCCQVVNECYNVDATVLCGVDYFEGDYEIGDFDSWQSYCLRGVIYNNCKVISNDYYKSGSEFVNLSDYDDCVMMSRTLISNNSDEYPFLPKYCFGCLKECQVDPVCCKECENEDFGRFFGMFPISCEEVCVNLNPCKAGSSIDWRCVQSEDIINPLADIIPESLYDVDHTVIIIADYWRYIVGIDQSPSPPNFYSNGYHLFYLSAYAFFDSIPICSGP